MLFNGDSELKCRIYNKIYYFNFDKVNYPFMDGNTPISPAYDVYVSRLVAFARICTGLQGW